MIALGAPHTGPITAPSVNGATTVNGVKFPPVDEYTIEPDTYTERWEGQIVHVMPSDPPHAIGNAALPAVLTVVLSPGYIGAVDMLTRVEELTEIAPDYCIFRSEKTADGHYEICDIAFEVLDTQTRASVLKRAKKFVTRGCRRVFLVDVKTLTVAEYDAPRDTWNTLANDFVIEDKAFATGVVVSQLFEAGPPVAIALRAAAARKDPALVAFVESAKSEGVAEGVKQGREEGREEGLEEGARIAAVQTTRGILLEILATKFACTNDSRVSACDDLRQLKGWLSRALVVTTLQEVFA